MAENSNQITVQSIQQDMYNRKFQIAFSTLGAVGTVIWAANRNRKGKFWWFIGGSMVGSSIGFLIDSLVKKPKSV